ncbi:hypothetical protein D9619_007741 [Psilocybe cf. subviscida]|uniref:Uncharacterized protein n=1 Tax=Psilocybe cf. subviscida TaxID=2480587 RepID=A0A8H5ESC0_9AGAR|nr:hypothetical protein D9619_007741 [Psilocybe cf. subviscida]
MKMTLYPTILLTVAALALASSDDMKGKTTEDLAQTPSTNPLDAWRWKFPYFWLPFPAQSMSPDSSDDDIQRRDAQVARSRIARRRRHIHP